MGERLAVGCAECFGCGCVFIAFTITTVITTIIIITVIVSGTGNGAELFWVWIPRATLAREAVGGG